MLYLWWTHGRDPHLRPIAAQYEPPNQLTPGEVGTLVDDSADMRDITASMLREEILPTTLRLAPDQPA